MLKTIPLLPALTLLLAQLTPLAHAAPECEVLPLPQSERSAQTVAAAKALRATDPCKLVPGLSPKSLRVVWAGLLSNRQTGGRRLDNLAPEGLPNGSVLPGPAGIHFDFRAVAAEQIRSFRLERDHAVLADTAAPPPELDVMPGGAGGDYRWVLVTRAASYHGEFTLLDGAERRDVEQQLAALEKSGLDQVTLLLYKAAIYDDASLYSERDRVYRQLRQLVAL
ncbi:hypothetical protein [Rugamonas sp.]|uniref:hypothetical protein n=1 Tax=Rugamonas sp. TaxID=1926287 RepID=UPI0025EAAC59|nr:hypothetical protein [Rugamonas sp.]